MSRSLRCFLFPASLEPYSFQ